MKVGEIIPADREIVLNEGKKTTKILVANKGDRPVQVGSHFHFFEVNKCLSFDREAAYGYHLDIPSGTSVRFEPGEEKEVQLTEMGGRKRVFGLNDLTRARAAEDTRTVSIGKGSIKGILIRRDTNERKNFR
jgi:urease_beta: urease, beta subunit